MKRSLLIYLFVALAQISLGQVQLFADTINSSCTTSVDVPIRVSNYVDMLSMQGTVHWDVSNLNYNSIVDYGPGSIGLTNGNFGFGSTGAGNLMFSWNDPNLSGETLPDSTIMFTLRFDVVGAGSFITPISFQNSPTLLEFVDLAYSPISYSTFNGAVDITCSSCAINSITAGIQTSCDITNDYYTQELTIVYTAPPGSGSISINGQLFPITGSPQVIVLDSLVSDGNSVDVTAFFTDNAPCALSQTAMFTAPASCYTNDVDIFADIINDGCVTTVDVPIRVSDFVDMLSMQGTVHWDVAYLNYNSIVDYGPAQLGLTNGNFGFGSTASGDLTFSWNDSDLSGESLTDSTIIFSLRFDVIATGVFSTPVSFQSTPTLLEFVNLSYTPIAYTTTNGSVNISCSTCAISAVVAGNQSSCNPSNNYYTQELTITYSVPPATGNLNVNGQLFPITGSPQVVILDSLIADGNAVDVNAFFTDDLSCLINLTSLFTAPVSCLINDVDIFADIINDGCVTTVDVPIRVSDFVDMLSMQGTVHWDVAYLNYNSIVNYGPAQLGLTNGNFGFGNTASGDLTFSWNDGDLSGESLTDSTIIFSLRFDVIATGVFSTPVSFQSTPTLLEFVNLSLTPIAYTTTNGSVNISCSTCAISTVVPGNQSSCNPSNNYYTQELTITYSVPPATGNLNVNGQLFSITGSPQVIILDSLISDGNAVDVNAFFTDDLTCLINLTSLFTAPTSCLTNDVDIFADLVSDSCAATVDVPVRVSDFVNMLSIQGTIHWDPSLLSYNSIIDYGPVPLSLTNGNFGFGSTAVGDLMFSWNDGDLSGESLTDSTILFIVRYDIIGVSSFSTPISFENTPTPLEFVNLSFTPIPYTTSNGNVTITCPPPNTIDIYYPEYACSNDSIYTIDVMVNNFDNIVSYQGTTAWDTTYFTFDSISYFGPTNVLLTNGNFGLPLVTQGLLTFSWYDGDLSGEDLADSTILFSYILNTTNTSFDCTPISFENVPTPLEFIDSATTEVATNPVDLTICKSFTYFDTLQICAGDSILLTGAYQTVSGDYTDVMVTVTGCDSIINYNLTVLPYNGSTDVQLACDSLTWMDGITYYADNNIATWVLTDIIGCDSTITLDLSVLVATISTDVQTACDSLVWIDGNTYYANNNTATFVLSNIAGCDSTIVLDLTILSSTTSTDIQTACDNYTWVDGNTYTTSNTTATWTFTNAVGCDSLVTLNLTMSYSSAVTDTQIACDSLLWIDGNTYYTNNNSAIFVLTNSAGCDSTVTLDLTINNANTGIDTQIACDSLIWIDGNTYYTNNNTASFVLTNSSGCDSTVTLNLIITTASFTTDTQSACDSITWIDGNTYYANNNTATFVLSNIAGCDSTVTLDLTILNSTTGTDVQTACDSYSWIDGNTYTISNTTATWTFTNAVGCDSLVTLNLTMSYSSAVTDTQIACDSLLWIDGNTYYTNNNSAIFVLTNSAGCDSTVTLDLTINNANTGIDTQIACDSLIWIDGNTYYADNNTASFVLTNSSGCDSTVTLDLIITTASFTTDTQSACDSIMWIDGNTYYANNNTATFVLSNIAGCDSTITLDLTILNSTTGTDIQTACDSYTWVDGNTYTTSNTTATWTFTNAVGCDSLVTLDLTMSYSSAVTDTQIACDSLLWIDGNTYYTNNNSATFVLTNSAGCDSTVTLDLTINNANTGIDTQIACDSLTWIDGNTYYTNNNTASFVLTNSSGCDSTVTLDLIITTASFTTDTQSACDSIMWIDGNTYYANNNTATFVLSNIAGCDSTVTLDLTILNSTTGTDIQTACDNYSWVDGNTYTTSNTTATWTFTNAVGCDNIVTLNLTMSYSSAVTDTQIACDSLLWIDGNTYYTNNNSATVVLTNSAGCDSTVTLDLTINNANTGIDTQIACDSLAWIDGNTYYADNNTASYVLTNSSGCDSTVTLNLIITTASFTTDTQSACDSITWIDGNTYYANNNTATFVLSNIAGCDSTVTLDLTILNSTTGTDIQTACDSYTWVDGNTYTTSNNTATWTFTNAVGCDSLVTLDLTMSYSSAVTDTQIACDSLLWIDGNTYYTNNNSATFVLTNSAGCDSTVTLDLTINNANTGIDTQIACDSLAWIDGNTYYADNNTASFVLTSSSGCDSTVTLALTINNSTSGTDLQTACDSYTWIDGNTYTVNNNTATWTLTNTNGCDSTVTLDLTINNSTSGTDTQTECITYTWIDGNTYTSSNNTATYTLTNSSGCDSIVTLNLTINTVNTSITQNDNITLAADQNGATYQWLDCDENFAVIANETSQTFIASTNGNYAVEISINGCVDTSNCVMIDEVGLYEKNKLDNISVYPIPNDGTFNVHLARNHSIVNLTLFNSMGQIILDIEKKDSQDMIIEFEGPPGIYILRVATENSIQRISIIKN